MTTCNHSNNSGQIGPYLWCRHCGALKPHNSTDDCWLIPTGLDGGTANPSAETATNKMVSPATSGRLGDTFVWKVSSLILAQFVEALSVAVKGKTSSVILRHGETPTHSEILQIDLPFVYPDGDRFCIYVEGSTDRERMRVSDNGTTSMRISFHSNDSEPAMVKKIVNQNGCEYDDGEIFTVGQTSDLLKSVFLLAVAMAKVEEAGEWVNRTRGFKAEAIG